MFAVPRAGTEGRPDVVADTWYAALLTGVALGREGERGAGRLIVLAMMVLRARAGASTAHRGRRFIVATAAIFAVSWAATAGYWYARNLLDTGNPCTLPPSSSGRARGFPKRHCESTRATTGCAGRWQMRPTSI